MTDENGMLRNGSKDIVGTAGRELNDSTPPSSSTIASTTTIAATTTTTTTPTTTAITATATITPSTIAASIPTATAANSVNNSPRNNDGNNNENATPQNNNNHNPIDRPSQLQSHSPIDTENGNNTAADHFVSGSGGVGGGGGGGSCASNGNYSTATGNGSNANCKQSNHSTSYTNSNNGSPLHNPCGGRLQFFKDGKFILELARSKEGDRGWISVPRKTYWPPAALSQNNLNNHKNESSTSLSFSDDNSSIQSSPWQRDHSWKQPSPRKNISKDLNLYYYRPTAIILSETSKLVSKLLRRQPHNGNRKNLRQHSVQYAKRNVSNKMQSPPKLKQEINEFQSSKLKLGEPKERNESDKNKDKDSGDHVDSPSIKMEPIDKENDTDNSDDKMDCNTNDENKTKLDEIIAKDDKKLLNCANNKAESKRQLRRSSKISNVIEKLIARVSDKPVNVTSTQSGLGLHFSSSASRPADLYFPHQHVSPRKRILREFEKVSLEDRCSNTQKRSRSKSNASTVDFGGGGGGGSNNSKSSSSANYSIVVAQHTANIACNNKDETNRIANGSPPRAYPNSMDTMDKPLKSARSFSSPNTAKDVHSPVSSESATPPVSKPISNYSIISLLGHTNSSSSNTDSRNDAMSADDRTNIESRRSPRSPKSHNHHQIISNSRSPYFPKKKSPTSTTIASTTVAASNALINSPTHYRSARSPDINSPSPGLQPSSHRYHSASLSSPTSSFHPYLSSSRASPLSSGTLSPTDLYRHRSYRAAGSPSTISNSSVSGLTAHPYASLNGSPTAFTPSNRYSPMSTYSSSTKTSPNSDRQSSSQSNNVSTAYSVSNLLPQSYDSLNVGGERHSPNATKQQRRDWSPARQSTTSASDHGSPANYANNTNCNNSMSTTTIPKKTASIRQKYGSLSPNGFGCGGVNSENASSSSSTSSSSLKNDTINSMSTKKSHIDQIADATKHLAKRPKSPEMQKKLMQSQELYEKDLQARYNAEMAAMHHQQQSLIASALQQQAAHPFYHMYGGGAGAGAGLPSTMAAAAAYMNPLYYHHPSAGELFRKGHGPAAAMDLLHKNLVPTWMDPYGASLMHYPSMAGAAAHADKTASAAKSQQQLHQAMLMSPYSMGRSAMPTSRDQPAGSTVGTAADIEMWNSADAKRSPITSPSVAPSSYRRQSQPYSDCEPISLIKDEQSSDVPLNLSKH